MITRQRKSALVNLVACLVALPVSASAQGLGLPLFSDGHRQVTVSLAAGRHERLVGGWPTISRVAYGKATLGFGGRLDLFVGAGFTDFDIRLADADLSNLTSEPTLTYGVGASLRVVRLRGLGVSLLASAGLWRSQPALSTRFINSGTGFERQVHLSYDWREATGAITLTKKVGVIQAYAGLGGYLIQRVEKQWAVLRTSVADVKGPVSKGEFRSGFVPEILAGFDFVLPQGFRISFEAAGRDRDNLGLVVGLSQTGAPR